MTTTAVESWRDKANGVKWVEGQPCFWGDTGVFIDEMKLPKTAAQFEFDIDLDKLTDLYRSLDVLARER